MNSSSRISLVPAATQSSTAHTQRAVGHETASQTVSQSSLPALTRRTPLSVNTAGSAQIPGETRSRQSHCASYVFNTVLTFPGVSRPSAIPQAVTQQDVRPRLGSRPRLGNQASMRHLTISPFADKLEPQPASVQTRMPLHTSTHIQCAGEGTVPFRRSH